MYEEGVHFVVLNGVYYLSMIGLIAFTTCCKNKALRSLSIVTADYLFRLTVVELNDGCDRCKGICLCNKDIDLAISGIYLYRLGPVKVLREALDIPDKYTDDMYVYKFGFSKNVKRRGLEHIRTYKKINGVKCAITEVFSVRILDRFYSAAETFIKNEVDFQGFRHVCEVNSVARRELIIASPSEEKNRLRSAYRMAEQEYLNFHVKIFQTRINELERELVLQAEAHKKEIKAIRKEHVREIKTLREEHKNEFGASREERAREKEIKTLCKEHAREIANYVSIIETLSRKSR